MQVLNDHPQPLVDSGSAVPPLDAKALLEMARGFAECSGTWVDSLETDDLDRTGLRILGTDRFDVWLLRWPPSTSVSPHDHGDSRGAFVVISGELTELRWERTGQSTRRLRPGQAATIDRGVVHDVVSETLTSLSLHVYSPPLTSMSYFDDEARTLRYTGIIDEETLVTAPDPASGIDRLLSAARSRIAPRMKSWDLESAQAEGALVVDTRPALLRDRDGELPGAVVIERNVLEWRLDHASPDRIPEATDLHRPVVIVCNEGYASSLAAAVLLDLGRTSVTDLEGGFQAWADYRRRQVT